MARNPIEELCDLMPGLELQSDRAAPFHTEPPRPTTLSSRQQVFPLMKLPTEVRFMIYAYALQQTIDRAIFPPFGTPKLMPPPVPRHVTPLDSREPPLGFDKEHIRCPPIVGALALLHTNRELRSESADELMQLALGHVQLLKIRAAIIFEDVPGVIEIVEARFQKMLFFKSGLERAIEACAEYWELFRDLKVGAKMYCLVSNVRHGTTGMDKSGSEYEEAMVKTGNLLRAAVGLTLRKLDWDFDTFGYDDHEPRENEDDDPSDHEHNGTLGYENDDSSEYEGDDEYEDDNDGDDDTLENGGDDGSESEFDDAPEYEDGNTLENES
jgi:hypothetical protein